MQHVLVTVCLVLAVAACEADDGEMQGDGSTGAEASWLPSDCSEDASPFTQAGCLDALRVACNAHATESECAEPSALVFDDGGYEVSCRWAEVATFSDPDTCALASMTGRCEATEATGCSDGLVGDVRAMPAQLELVKVCGGPLGAWAEVGASSESAEEIGACGPNLSPPEPALCACADGLEW